jgi:diazepam-binding inhibitor (GABA receptor modulating acyl-CoA-binding protein)
MSRQSSTLDEQFNAAVEYVRQTPTTTPISNDTKLLYYAYFKQATMGDVSTNQPSVFWFKERAKWDAWNALKGTSQDQAKSQYIRMIHESPK